MTAPSEAELTSAAYSYQASESYAYDANGNPASAVLDSANRVMDDGTYTYTYDADGNRSTRTNKATGTVDTYSYTFNKTGTYDYICGLHPNMMATIKVTN